MASPLNVLLDELGISAYELEERGLATYEEAQELVTVQMDANGRCHELIRDAAHAWHAMKTKAEHEGIELIIVSAFRSVERQAEIVRRKLENGAQLCDILSVSAAPGYSEHHTGRAVDLAAMGGPVLEPEFESTPAFQWLMKNAGSFSFYLSYPKGNRHGYMYEPWHWCYRALNMRFDTDASRRST